MSETNSTGNPREVIFKLWRHAFGGEHGLLQIFTIIRNEHGETPREGIKSHFFNYPNVAKAAAKYALERAAEGREVYFAFIY